MINVVNKEMCCGCTACASICGKDAISMEIDNEGFLYPKVDLNKCIDCHLCEKVCPVNFRDRLKQMSKPQIFLAGRLNNFDDLMKSSSGGAFWAFAQEAISRNGVVVGAMYSENMCVIHGFADSIELCKKFRGSKYSQSNVEGVFPKVKKLLQSGKFVLYTGNPCQVQGLKLYLRKSYDNLITVDLVCHAVSSPKIFKEYCNFSSDIFGKRIVSINMRDKSNACRKQGTTYRYFFDDGTSEIDSGKVANWGKLFFSQYINRPSCHSCRFTNLHRPGDISIGDFWDFGHNRDDIRNINGTSLILINSEKGKTFFDASGKYFDLFEVSEKDSLQPNLIRPTQQHKDREKFWMYYHKYGFPRTYKKFFADSCFAKCKKRVIIVAKKIEPVGRKLIGDAGIVFLKKMLVKFGRFISI